MNPLKKPNITPGDWQTVGELDDLCVIVTDSEDPRACDGEMQIAHVVCGQFELTHYEMPEANAKAISAVPQMMAALERILEFIPGALKIINAHRRQTGGEGDIAAMNLRGCQDEIREVLVLAGYTEQQPAEPNSQP